MAEIFRARLTGLGGFTKEVALKRLLPQYTSDRSFVDMLFDEARITAQLNHANIVQILDIGQEGRQFYIAMELVDGRDLFQVVKTLQEQGRKMSVEAAAFVVREVLAGLHYAHHKRDESGRPLRIVHRDVSPQNVLLSFEGDVKLIDFGIAKAEQRLTSTSSGIIKGKFHYMSPEQARGMPLDVRTDVFSAGIVLYEAITASPVYDESAGSLLALVREASIPIPTTLRDDVPRPLERIVMRALAPDPNDRFQTALEFHRALSAFLGSRNVEYTRLDLGRFLRGLMNVPVGPEREATESRHPIARRAPRDPAARAAVRTERQGPADSEAPELRFVRGALIGVVAAIALILLVIVYVLKGMPPG